MQQLGGPRSRALTLLAGLALVVAACGADDDNGGGVEPTPGDGTPMETPMESPGESPMESPGESPLADFENPSFGQIGGQVSVVGSWTGSEENSFLQMVAPFEEMTGVDVIYTGSRDLAAQLTTGIASGNLPDVAGLPGPGLMNDWYQQGAVLPLNDVIDVEAYRNSTPPGLADLGIQENGDLTGVFIKSAVKGLIWYNTNYFEGDAIQTWDELQGTDPEPAEALWCVGFESGAASGWPGTDWIEDIVLRQAGPDAYDAWVNGELAWTSDEIRGAFETMQSVIENAYGGSDYIVNTNFGQAANPMFDDPPGCKFHHQASFISDFFENEAGAQPEDYSFFKFPDINEQYPNAVVGAGDLFGMFNDTEQAQALMQWLVTAQAQRIWAEQGGGFLGANINVPVEDYPDEAARRAAEIITSAETFRFDGSDQMPNAMNDAFFSAMVQFAQNPDNLDSILQELDQVQQDAYNQ